MATNVKKKEDVEKKKGGKVVLTLFVLLTVLFVGFIAAVKFDVLGLGNNFMRPLVGNIPVINLILPPIKEAAATSAENGEAYNFETIEAAVESLKLTEKMLMEKSEEAEKVYEQISLLEQEILRLKAFEDGFVEFEASKQLFYEEVAKASGEQNFTTWYETMNPTIARSMYEELILKGINEEELASLILMYGAMKPANAAPILEIMASTQINMVASILKGVEAKQAGAILSAMNTDVAANLTTYMYPVETNQ